MVLTDPYNYQGEIYDKENKYDLLSKFLSTYSYKPQVYTKEKPFEELTVDKYKDKGICGKKFSDICIIAFT